jgi:hypothetical protein
MVVHFLWKASQNKPITPITPMVIFFIASLLSPAFLYFYIMVRGARHIAGTDAGVVLYSYYQQLPDAWQVAANIGMLLVVILCSGTSLWFLAADAEERKNTSC